MNKIIICYGTRPELIKLAPLIWIFKKNNLYQHLILVNSNQHKQTMHEDIFGIEPHYNLDVFEAKQSMAQMAAKIYSRLDSLINHLKEKKYSISALITQGDTITTLCSAQTAFYNQIPIYHIEAGLRSENIFSPYPEEFNRRTVSQIASLHFAPSCIEKNNLLREGICEEKIKVVGNTVNDVLLHYFRKEDESLFEENKILISIHRKSNQNDKLQIIIDQILELVEEFPNYKFIWLMHPAPYISEIVSKYDNKIAIKSNLPYNEMILLYKNCKMVITDSGGIFEESAFLGIPRIIIRNDNERLGLLDADDTFLNDPSERNLKESFYKALNTKGVKNYTYGTGNASKQIFSIIVEQLKLLPTTNLELLAESIKNADGYNKETKLEI